MKILFDAHLSENKITGSGRYINGLILALLEQDKTNEYFLLVNNSIKSDHPLSQIESSKLTKIPIDLTGPSLRQHILIPKLLNKLKPDVYHHPHFDLPLFHKTPSVVTIHDLKYIRNPHFFPELCGVKRWYMKTMIAQSVKRARKIITVSNSTKLDLIDLFKISDEKIEVVYHGLEKNLQQEINIKKRNQVLRKYGILDKFILFVGERRPHKNIVNLITAFKLAKNNLHNNVKLLIIGKSYSNYQEPEKEIKRHRLENEVIIADFVSDEELSIFYKTAEMLILPSYYEGFGFPLIEAMSCKIPVIAADNTSMPEIVGDAGLLINPDEPDDISEKIISVLKDNNLREKLIYKGLKNIERFTWEKAAQQTLQVYNQVYSSSN